MEAHNSMRKKQNEEKSNGRLFSKQVTQQILTNTNKRKLTYTLTLRKQEHLHVFVCPVFVNV